VPSPIIRPRSQRGRPGRRSRPCGRKDASQAALPAECTAGSPARVRQFHTRTGSRLTSSMATGVLDRMWGPRKPFRGVLIRRGFESLPSVWDVLTHHRVLTSHTSPPSPGITCETAHLRRFLGSCATCLCDGEGVYAGARKSAPSARRGSTKRNRRRGATARYATWIVDGTTRKATKHVDTADHETSADHPDGAGLVGL
jgi:hypothetical protein